MRLSADELRALIGAARVGRKSIERDDRHVKALDGALLMLRRELRDREAREQELARMGEAQRELRKALDELWLEAGEPSVRQMARHLGMSHMTWHNALRCNPVPAWEPFAALVSYLHGSPGDFEELWLRAKGKIPSS